MPIHEHGPKFVRAVNEALFSALRNEHADGKSGNDVRFALQDDGSAKSTVFPAAFESKAREVLERFGLLPELAHDQTHRHVRRIALSIPATQILKPVASKQFSDSDLTTVGMLQSITGLKWTKNEDHTFSSQEVPDCDIFPLRRDYFPDVASGGEVLVDPARTPEHSHIIVTPSYAIQWVSGQFYEPDAHVEGLNALAMQRKAHYQPQNAQQR